MNIPAFRSRRGSSRTSAAYTPVYSNGRVMLDGNNLPVIVMAGSDQYNYYLRAGVRLISNSTLATTTPKPNLGSVPSSIQASDSLESSSEPQEIPSEQKTNTLLEFPTSSSCD